MGEHKHNGNGAAQVVAEYVILISFEHSSNYFSWKCPQQHGVPWIFGEMFLDEAMRQLDVLRPKVDSTYAPPEFAEGGISSFSVIYDCKTKRVIIGGDILPVPILQMGVSEVRKQFQDANREIKLRAMQARFVAEQEEAKHVGSILDSTGGRFRV